MRPLQSDRWSESTLLYRRGLVVLNDQSRTNILRRRPIPPTRFCRLAIRCAGMDGKEAASSGASSADLELELEAGIECLRQALARPRHPQPGRGSVNDLLGCSAFLLSTSTIAEGRALPGPGTRNPQYLAPLLVLSASSKGSYLEVIHAPRADTGQEICNLFMGWFSSELHIQLKQ
jgi:hypothetical protein